MTLYSQLALSYVTTQIWHQLLVERIVCADFGNPNYVKIEVINSLIVLVIRKTFSALIYINDGFRIYKILVMGPSCHTSLLSN